MEKFGNFLWKIFSVTMVFLCHMESDSKAVTVKYSCGTGASGTPPATQSVETGNNLTLASSAAQCTNSTYSFANRWTDGENSWKAGASVKWESDADKTLTAVWQYIADDPKLTSEFFRSSDDARPQTATIRLCRSGEYLAKCGSSAPLGTNWLKGLDKRTKGGKTVTTTPDFYSYKESASDSIHMDNLRKFFSGKGNIEYTKKVGSGSSTSYSASHVSANEYVKYRNQILSNFCTNSDGDVADIVCNTCPNNAMVAASTVQKDSYDTGKILWDSWNVHTIADCYMQEFNDDSGTYVYVDDRTESSSNTNEGALCYYSKNVNGVDSLYYTSKL